MAISWVAMRNSLIQADTQRKIKQQLGNTRYHLLGRHTPMLIAKWKGIKLYKVDMHRAKVYYVRVWLGSKGSQHLMLRVMLRQISPKWYIRANWQAWAVCPKITLRRAD